MRNPLNRRFIRDLKSDLGKYAVIFLLLVFSISEGSGFLVADESMLEAYNESFETYNVEDGNFTTERMLNRGQRTRIEAQGVRLTELFFVDRETDYGATMRFFKNRTEVNRACLMDGRFPEQAGEIAIDRMHADNNGLHTGDTFSCGDEAWTITGLVALSDYSALFSDNNDMMFDAARFGVGVVCDSEFDTYAMQDVTPCYAWKYEDAPSDDTEADDRAETFLKALAKEADLTDFIPRYQNQAIMFTGNDFGADRQLMEVVLYIIIVILAFVFAVTISNTIVKEANVIGTLRATGYTKAEMIRHYMFMPVVVTLVAAIIGNILGYTVMKDVNAALYYNSYSLPTYETRWSAQAFLQTTLIPVAIMLVIDYMILSSRLSLSPLKFLRRDLTKRKQHKAVPLNRHIPFFTRFRVRVILQNLANYALLFIGICFANVLLMFGLLLPGIIRHYQETLSENLLCDYQYILQLPAGAVDEEEKLNAMLKMMMFSRAVETSRTDAEKFSAYSLKTPDDGRYKSEEVLLYGIGEDSRYVDLEFPRDDSVFISAVYAEKYRLAPGDTITLREPYGEESYTFPVTGISDYEGAICVFMKQAYLNEIFDLGKDTFSGYFSGEPLTDIDKTYIGSVIDLEALTKVSRQLDHSMGSFMKVLDIFAVAMFVILIYLLSKTIIEKNAYAISMTKILGYTNGEISALYILSTTIMVACFIMLSLPVAREVIHILYRVFIIERMSGWIPFLVSTDIYVTIIALGFATYLVVALLEYGKVRRVPMDEALKVVE
ncbi:MAG: FtsX-like permease family protein [Lachnospiraceae bacterium]|nr:FtsX-like permease family protein [Lachnospiraceae bacterium]